VGVMSTYAGDPLICIMFPDTEIAKTYGSRPVIQWSHQNKYSCGLVSDYSNYIGSHMENQPFSVTTDGSSDC